MNFLKKQLEDSRFESTLSYIRTSAKGLKHLGPNELAQLNQMITGNSGDDPWRSEPATIVFPSGKSAEFSLVSNPFVSTRNLISYAREMIKDGATLEGATFLYSQLVMNHFFKDANRRTAVAAVYWLVYEADYEIDAKWLLEQKLGDLREEGEIRKLKAMLKAHLHALE